MIKVGVTGGIGSGKTLVCEIFKHLGVPVFHADLEAKEIYVSDQEVTKQIKQLFGQDIYHHGELKKDVLAKIIFNDSKALDKVNSIVHPKVREYFLNWAEKQTANYVIEEAAILFESNAYLDLDYIINVHARQENRIKRVMKRDGISREHVLSRMKNQLCDEKRMKLADFTIYNDDERMLLPQVMEIHQKILSKL
ncbi:MAG: dephospho-CoA kinase [Bacteroidales bacterium]|jgi:dephospho-CoA kinase|nr:dephospho-CoA kinase [Bacteroidales bacterium]